MMTYSTWSSDEEERRYADHPDGLFEVMTDDEEAVVEVGHRFLCPLCAPLQPGHRFTCRVCAFHRDGEVLPCVQPFEKLYQLSLILLNLYEQNVKPEV